MLIAFSTTIFLGCRIFFDHRQHGNINMEGYMAALSIKVLLFRYICDEADGLAIVTVFE